MGKGGSSSNASSTSTTSTDKRMVVDGSSIGISSDSSTVNVSATDYGAIEKALNTVNASNSITGQSVAKLLDTQDKMSGRVFDAQGNLIDAGLDLFSRAFNIIDTNAALVDKASSNVAAAYDTAQTLGKTADSRYLVAAGMAVVAVVAVAAFGKKI